MIIYAGVRGHKVVTQLPATYRTTQAPRTISNALLDHMFPKSEIPAPTYEFPALTFCPTDTQTTLTVLSCFRESTVTKDTCASAGQYRRNMTIEGADVACLTINDPLSAPLAATSTDDVLEVTVSVVGTADGSPEGAVVITHPQVGGPKQPLESHWGFDNVFGASAYTATEIVGKKLYTIDAHGAWKETFEIKASSVRLKIDTAQLKPFVRIEFRYPKLEATYEKSFLVLDMNNWLGEVGGVAALLFFLLRAFSAVVAFLLKRSDNFAYTDLGKEYRAEGFAHY
ncbi:hypothetical protein HDU86_004618 [Geranomyces michiganensis]|nr:hypothetical protein HDU86_004618 [Geranomyces michiganensis]